MDGPLTTLRLTLLGQGYEPIPVVGPQAPGSSPGKRPGIRGWQVAPLDQEVIRAWAQGALRDCTNTGLRTGRLVGVDIDVLDETLAKALQDMALRLLGPTPLQRIGKAPKLLLCYQAIEPAPKRETPEFRLPDGSKAQVEILGQGQQFVAYGVHPDTRAEYAWPDLGPDVVALAELPQVGIATLRAFLAAAEALIRDAGGAPIKVEEKPAREPPAAPSGPAGAARESDFFRNTNTRALADVGRWFTQLFPRGYWQRNDTTPPGTWRVRSSDLGRSLEEDISVHPNLGARDFGTRERVTPIDLVVRYGGVSDRVEAAFKLCDWIGVTPESLGWRADARKGKAHAGVESPESDGQSRTGPSASLARQLSTPCVWTTAPPPRAWIVPDWVPRGVVTGLYGDGAVGKSLAAMQLLSAVALSESWFGLEVAPGRALGVFCEDDEAELQRRQWSINRAWGIAACRLENLRYLPRLGQENALITFDGSDVGTPTTFTAELDELCGEFRPDLLVLDTIADLFPANENDRSKVRQFVQTILGGLARRHGCAVLALGHPSVSGMNSGSGQSGSTAWNNTFRSRIYLSRLEGEEADPNGRLLSRKKANYAARDAEIRLQWHEGAFRVAPASESRMHDIDWAQISAIFDEIERAWQAGRPWSHRPEARRNGRMLQVWAQRMLKIPEKRLTMLLSDWLMQGFLSIEEVNRHSKVRGLRVLKRLHPEA
ncbi:MAG TPA: AAA family ATPase [Geminicoccus sp.]|uniref:AAA family ATPase n=1 Tax=Geminicoccus sp. TaxID=2024832 RepID=UPI002BBC3050|nr:AAA family ATPase [Geminicoccus sp.]HWL69430.1 AAA family ATPase [Geminicoccus sp.]